MSLRRILIIFISLIFVVFAVYGASLFLLKHVDYDILYILEFFGNKKIYVIPGVFVVSMFIGHVFQKIMILTKKTKPSYKFFNLDKFAVDTYFHLFRCMKDKDYNTLVEACDSDMIHSLRIITEENKVSNVPVRVDSEVVNYDHREGIFSVICTGFFSDNTISKHRLTFARNEDDEYMLHEVRCF